jgi:hypothetical protein
MVRQAAGRSSTRTEKRARAVARTEEAQAAAAAQGVRGRGLRLEADAFGVPRRDHLPARIALEELDLDPPARDLHREPARLVHAIERVIEHVLSQDESPGGPRLARADRDLVGVQRQRAHRGQLDVPALARGVRQDAHGVACVGVLRRPAGLREELVSAMAQQIMSAPGTKAASRGASGSCSRTVSKPARCTGRFLSSPARP